MAKTLKKIVKEAALKLSSKKIDNAEHDALMLLLNTINLDMAKYLTISDDELTDDFIDSFIDEYDELVDYRLKHFPLQYLLTEEYFCGLRFNVDQNVLIPRADTETLVEKVLFDNPDKNKTVLDICTGSGCIAISLSKLGEYIKVVASDISREALEVASQNADENDINIKFVESNLFDNITEKYDIITCNPPYIKSSVLKTLEPEVSKYEPKLALDGGKDGLDIYKEIAKNLKDHLNPDGKIYLEIGYDQKDDVKKVFSKYKYVDCIKDLAGNDRVMIFGI